MIRPTRRRLRRSRRLNGPGPLIDGRCARFGGQTAKFGDRLEFGEVFRPLLSEPAHDANIAKQLGEIGLGHGEMQIIEPEGLLDRLDLHLQAGQLTLQSRDLLARHRVGRRALSARPGELCFSLLKNRSTRLR
jgi:hypothetical protein